MLNNHILYLHTLTETRIVLGSSEMTLKQQLQKDAYLKLQIVLLLSGCTLKISSHPLFA